MSACSFRLNCTAPPHESGMKPYNNLPEHQHPVQRLADQFNADERQWQKVRKKLLQALRNFKKRQRRFTHAMPRAASWGRRNRKDKTS